MRKKLTIKKLPALPNEMLSLQEKVQINTIRAEKQTWDNVLTTALGRTPTLADYKRCKKVKEAGDTPNGNYTLYFDNVALGRMLFETDSLVFHPAKRFR